MTNHPEDCQGKQCPWDEPEQQECSICFSSLGEDEVEQGFCNKHLELSEE